MDSGDTIIIQVRTTKIQVLYILPLLPPLSHSGLGWLTRDAEKQWELEGGIHSSSFQLGSRHILP